MKKLHLILTTGLIALSTPLILAKDKLISRIINKSNEFEVSIVPYPAEIQDEEVGIDTGHTISYMPLGEFDVSLKSPILANPYEENTMLKIIVGAEEKEVKVDEELQDGENILIIEEDKSIEFTPPTYAVNEEEAQEESEDIRNTYITEIINKSDRPIKTINILPFTRSVAPPTGTKNYRISSKEELKDHIILDEALFIGSDLENAGIILRTTPEDGPAIYNVGTSEVFKNLSSKNTLVIQSDGTPTLEPLK